MGNEKVVDSRMGRSRDSLLGRLSLKWLWENPSRDFRQAVGFTSLELRVG